MTMSQEATEDYCTICGKPRSAHPFRHAFASTSTGNTLQAMTAEEASQDDDPPSMGVSQLGGDPILRLALIRRGIITPDDLTYVEDELKGAGIAVSENMGKPRER